jgi:hypothetical protein
MNARIKELAEQATSIQGPTPYNPLTFEVFDKEKFADLIVRDCLNIAKNWDDQLVNANLVKESNAVGIVAYRIARQFGVEQ